jgi:3-methyl-2-oxobutanoate hydroxymethyltransferase
MPRHGKRYADLATEEARLQRMRVEAFQTFAADVHAGGYPDRGHEVHVDDEVLAAAKALVA